MERRKLLIGLGFILLVFVLVWLAVILRWQLTNRVPNTADVVLYLFGLPLLLLATFWGVNKGGNLIKQRLARKASSQDGAATAEADPDDPSLRWQLPLVAIDVILPQGDSAAALIAACKEGKRPELHAKLKDSKQQPAFAADIKDLDVQAVEDGLPALARDWPPARKRKLALAEMLATRLLDEHFDALKPAEETDAETDKPSKQPLLLLDWLLPSDWQESDYALAQSWLNKRLAEQGWQAPELRLVTRVLPADSSVLLQIDQLNRAYHEETLTLPRLLLVSDSAIDEQLLLDWDQQRQLYKADMPEGLMPGEGAAALLVAPQGHPAKPLPLALSRVFSGARKKAVSLPQRLESERLLALAKQVLALDSNADDKDATQEESANDEAAADEAPELQMVSDTDYRPSRTAEALHFGFNLLPEQDSEKSLFALGTANGAAAAVLPLAALAVACHDCVEAQRPTLVFSHQHAQQRYVMRVAPVAPSADTPAATV